MNLFYRLTLLSLLIFGGYKNSVAQYIEIQGPDTIYACVAGPITLYADIFGLDSSQLTTASAISNCDDCWSGAVNIGFTFPFYGNNYTQCVLGANGLLTFDISLAGGYCPWPISNPIPSSLNPMNSIMGAWQDLYPGANASMPGWLTYATIGTAPNRIFIFNMSSVPMYSCISQCGTSQIQLYETSGNIEIHIAHKEICSTWNSGYAILGIQNSTGTAATAVYNYPTQWTATNEAWLFTPSGANSYTSSVIPFDPYPVLSASQLQWTWQSNPVLGTTGDSVTINVTSSGWAQVEFSQNTCYGTGLSSGADSVYIAMDISNFTQSKRVSACNNPADNALFINFPGNLFGPFDLVWTDASANILATSTDVMDSSSLTNIPAGTYHVVITNSLGCTFNYNYVIPVHTMSASFTSSPSLICQNSTVTFTNASTGFINDYYWNFGDNDNDYTQSPAHIYYGADDSLLVIMTISNDTFPSCTFSDSTWLNIHPNIVADFSYDTPLCTGNTVKFKDQSFPYPVTWFWITDDSLISITNSAKYKWMQEGVYPFSLVVVDSLCGVDTLTDMVFIYNYPVVDLGNDTLMCPGESIELDAGNAGDTYLWSNNMVTQLITLTPDETILVSVEVSHMGCKEDDEILLTMNCSMLFPNAFSPNSDGINDMFMPHLINMKSYDFYVYNRWGQLVFSSKGNKGDTGEGWDGSWKNQLQPVGVYVYYANGIDIRDRPVNTMGNVSLLR